MISLKLKEYVSVVLFILMISNLQEKKFLTPVEL